MEPQRISALTSGKCASSPLIRLRDCVTIRHMALFRPPFRPNYAQKLSILATLPLVVAVAAIALLVAFESRSSAEREIQALQQQLLAAKKAELRNYVTQARNGFSFI